MQSVYKQISKHWRPAVALLAVIGLLGGIWQLTTHEDSVNATAASSSTPPSQASTDLPKSFAFNKNNSAKNTQSKHSTSTTKSQQASSSEQTTKQVAGRTQTQITSLDKLSPSRLSAESAIVWNRATKEAEFSKNIHTEQPLASLTKLMTALAAKRTTQVNDATTSISQMHLQAHGQYKLTTNQVWSLDQLIDYMLIASANDAARAIAAAASGDPDDGYASDFIDEMNTTAKQLGLDSTYFFNPSGLDINENLISGGYGTAHDTAQLFDYILTQHPQLLTPTTQPKATLTTHNGKGINIENTNTAISDFNQVIGSKTGYTELAGGNLAMGFNLEQPIVIVVLGATKQGRFTDMKKLYTATQKYFDTIQASKANQANHPNS